MLIRDLIQEGLKKPTQAEIDQIKAWREEGYTNNDIDELLGKYKGYTSQLVFQWIPELRQQTQLALAVTDQDKDEIQSSRNLRWTSKSSQYGMSLA